MSSSAATDAEETGREHFNDESGQVDDEYGTIEIMPAWKWLLQPSFETY